MHLYCPLALVSNPLEIISVPEVVNSPWGIGGVQLYPLGAAGAKSIELSSNLSTVTLAVYQLSKERRNEVG